MTKHFSIKSILLAVILILSFCFLQNAWLFAGIIGQNHTNAVVNDTTQDAINSIDATSNLSNNNFASSTGSTSYPRTPSSWSVWDEDTLITPETSGLIDITSATYQLYKDDYGLNNFAQQPPIRQGVSEQMVLLINSGNSGNESTSLNYGYKNDSDITLEANSFYSISLYVYTSSNAHASVYLTGDDVESLDSAKIVGINTLDTWQQVTFYIETGTDASSSVGLELFLGEKGSQGGSAGFVLFDNVSITRYSGDSFEKVKDTGRYFSSVSLAPSYITERDGFVTNGNFVESLTNGWNQETSQNSVTQYVADFNRTFTINDDQVIIGTNQRGDTTGVLLTTENGYNAIKSDDIEIKRHGLYRITFWAKGELESGNINFVMSGNLPDETVLEETEQSQTISTIATNTQAINNNWAMYTFYVEGNPLFDCTVNLTLGIGTESASATGYIAIAGIQSEKVTTAQKDDATSTNGNTATLSMYNTATLTFANGTFNLINVDESMRAPYAPQNWTALNENNTTSGVVNISSVNWAQTGLGFARPAKPNGDYSDNVLMIRNETLSYQGYDSESVSLDADGYAEITFQAYTTNLNASGRAYVTIKNTDGIILHQVEINNTNTWNDYTIYLHNYYVAQDIVAELSLGTEDQNASGRAYFDNVIVNTSLTEDAFNSANENSTTFVVDLSSNSLTASTNGTPTYWTSNSTVDPSIASSGIMDVRDYENYFMGQPLAPSDEQYDVLYIAATEPTYYYLNSNLVYNFTSGTYYKVSVLVRTVDITPDVDGEYDESGNQIIHGASIGIDGIDSSFSGINTAKEIEYSASTPLAQKFEDDKNAWVEYTMYINTTSDVEGIIRLGLGSSTMPTTGYVFFANLTVESMTEDEYNSATSTLDTENLPNNIVLATNTITDEETDSTGTYNPMDWFAIPTIIIAVAVIVAVVGFYIKKFYQSRPAKKTIVNTDYDRLQTLLKDVDRRERKSAIKHKLDLLHQELKQSQEFLQQELAELEKQKEAFNTAKEIAHDSPSVELELPDIKQIEKEIKTQQEKIEQIEGDIRILESERDRMMEQVKKETEKAEQKKAKKEQNIKKRK